MKSVLQIVLIGLLSGFAGSYLFTKVFPTSGSAQTEVSSLQIAEDSMPVPNFANNPRAEGSNRASAGIPGDISLVPASKISTPSVVYIKTLAKEQYDRYSFFDLFFNPRLGERKVAGSGSGVIFSEDGYIVTNNHVIEGANEIEVVHEKRAYQAKVVGIDPSTDLALLKVEASGLPAIKVASSQKLEVGDWVLAVGNPFNLTSTVTAGIVSAKGRRINILEDVFPIESFIQTDAAINPGNSGGALVNISGELVGINTAILSRTGSYAGYGFAVPSDIVTKVVHDLKAYGEVQKAFMGVDIVEIDQNLSDKLGLSNLNGVIVSFLEEGGSAQQAGLQKGDIILQIDDFAISDKAAFNEVLGYHSPGDKVSVQYQRDKKTFNVSLVLTNVEGTTGVIQKEVYTASDLGVVFESVPKVERARLGINAGVRIKNVDRGLIRQMGLEEGFIITAINNYEVGNPEELAQILLRIRGRVIVEGINKSGAKKYFSYYF